MSAQLKPIPGPMPHTPEWYALRVYDPERAERPVVISASRAQAAIENPLELFLQATGRLAEPEQTEDMEVGLLMEPVVMEMYRRRSGNSTKVGLPMYFHPEHKFMAATPDAIGFRPDSGRRWGNDHWGVDAKTSNDRMFLRNATAEDDDKYGPEGGDMVPAYVLWQMQAQCAVMGFPYVDVPVLFGRKYRMYRVHRDEQLIAALIAAEKELAERIVNDDPPPANYHAESTRECIRALYGLEPGLVVPIDEGNFARWTEVQRRKAQIKELEEANKADMNMVLAGLGSAQVGTFPSGTKGIKRIPVAGSVWSEDDIDAIRTKIGQVKRKSYEQLRECKV
jgi:predicted phage-related endonuclease